MTFNPDVIPLKLNNTHTHNHKQTFLTNFKLHIKYTENVKKNVSHHRSKESNKEINFI